MATPSLPASLPAFDESVVLSGIHARICFYDPEGRELPGRRELRRFSHLAASVEQTLTLAPDPAATELQNEAARVLEQINTRRAGVRK